MKKQGQRKPHDEGCEIQRQDWPQDTSQRQDFPRRNRKREQSSDRDESLQDKS